MTQDPKKWGDSFYELTGIFRKIRFFVFLKNDQFGTQWWMWALATPPPSLQMPPLVYWIFGSWSGMFERTNGSERTVMETLLPSVMGLQVLSTLVFSALAKISSFVPFS